jgi:segregation and condensation protein B
VTDSEIKKILEALLFVSEKPLMVAQVRELFGPEVASADLERLFTELRADYEQNDRALRIVEVADGFQMVTNPALVDYIAKLNRKVRRIRLTKPSLETLAIIAYRQPLTKVEMENIRGVDVSGVLDTLLRLNLIKITGRKEVVGRPLLYGTTREFLEHFGLKNMTELPSLEELQGVPQDLKEVAGISATESGAEIADDAAQESVER